MEQFMQALAKFGPPDAAAAKALAASLVEHRLDRGQFWIRGGDVCMHLAFLETGMVRHYYQMSSGQEVTRWVSLDSSYLLCLASFLEQKPTQEFIQALAPCRIWACNHLQWNKLCKEYSWLQWYWTKHMEFFLIGFEQRVTDLIAATADERYERMAKEYPLHLEKVPLQYIAGILGITPQHLSRIRAQEARKKS